MKTILCLTFVFGCVNLGIWAWTGNLTSFAIAWLCFGAWLAFGHIFLLECLHSREKRVKLVKSHG